MCLEQNNIFKYNRLCMYPRAAHPVKDRTWGLFLWLFKNVAMDYFGADWVHQTGKNWLSFSSALFSSSHFMLWMLKLGPHSCYTWSIALPLSWIPNHLSHCLRHGLIKLPRQVLNLKSSCLSLFHSGLCHFCGLILPSWAYLCMHSYLQPPSPVLHP